MSVTPISPTIQQYQQQMQQNQQGSSSEEAAFHKKFGDAAFNILSAKYPQLTKYVVTYKVLDSDVEEGSGTGAFIIRKGNSVVYIPIIMDSGKISSCEMIYDKDDQSFEPLSKDTVNQIEASNNLQDPSVVDKPPHIESTKQMFHDMFRPPSRSNVVIASDSDVSNLPNSAKEKIASYFQEHPEFLAKVAEFYPVEALGSKLAIKQEKTASGPEAPMEVLRLSEITKEASQVLDDDQKEELLQRGYFVPVPDTPRVKVASVKNLAKDAVTRLDLTEYTPSRGAAATGATLHAEGADIKGVYAVLAENTVLTEEGYFPASTHAPLVFRPIKDVDDVYYRGTAPSTDSSAGSALISGLSEGITANDLLNLGGVMASDTPNFTAQRNVPVDDQHEKVFIFYPTRSGDYQLFPYWTPCKFALSSKKIEEDIYWSEKFNQENVGFLSHIKKGYVRTGEYSFILPKESIIIVKKRRNVSPAIKDISALYRLLNHYNPKLSLTIDAGELKVTDAKAEKTATYRDEADYMRGMVQDFSLSKEAADLLLKEKEILLLDKVAFVQPSPIEYGNQTNAQPTMPFNQPQDPQAGQIANDYQINDEVMQSAAELQDEDLMDTGILASVASNEDIKGTMVDLLPNFSDTVTNLGKVILMFTSAKEDMENHYGSDQYNSTLSNVRKIFKSLGELVYDLKSYINMHQKEN
jgi:hypothetical protein